MTKRKYQVAVILINYNSSQYTLDCVETIFAKTSKELTFQIILIDNNSAPEESRKLERLASYADVQVFFGNINLGFSGANMAGVGLADAEYYYFLNNDCVLLNDCLEILY